MCLSSSNTSDIPFDAFVYVLQQNGFDVAFGLTFSIISPSHLTDFSAVAAYCPYAILRVYGVYYDSWCSNCWIGNIFTFYLGLWARTTGMDCLALIACLMFPRWVSQAWSNSSTEFRIRLAFVTLKNNLMVLSLRAMMTQFVILMFIAAFCFCGFLYALWT